MISQGAAVEAPEPVSSYRINLSAVGSALDVSGSARFPALRESASAFDFYLSALIRAPRLAVRCGGRRWSVAAIATRLEGGDRKWTLHGRGLCAAGSSLELDFGYRLQGIAAPQMRIADGWSFAGGGGELWYPQRAFSERQVARIAIDVPASFTAIATGVPTRVSRHGSRAQFSYRAAFPAKLAFAYGPYVEAVAEQGHRVRVLSSTSAVQAESLVRLLEPIISALTNLYGPAPFSDMALVEVPFGGLASGTSEYGMIFADAARMRGAFDANYWAHEFGHQWWGNAVVRAASGTAGATLLTEGLAQYGAFVALQATGRASSAAFTQRLASYRAVIGAGRDKGPATFTPANQEEVLLAHRLATSKGALVLRYFANLVGEARFHALLRSFLAAHSGRRVSWAEFEAWLHRDMNDEYRWFFEQWLHRPGAPELTISYCAQGRSVRGEIVQRGTPFRLLLPFELSGSWGSRRVAANADGTASHFNFEAPGAVERLALDPDALVPTASASITRLDRCQA
jgi:hypothetical protein